MANPSRSHESEKQKRNNMLTDALSIAPFPPGLPDTQLMLMDSDANTLRDAYLLKKRGEKYTFSHLRYSYNELKLALDIMFRSSNLSNLPLAMLTMYGSPELNQVLMQMMSVDKNTKQMLLENVNLANLEAFYSALKQDEPDSSDWFLTEERFHKHIMTVKNIMGVLFQHQWDEIENQPIFPNELRFKTSLMENARSIVEWDDFGLPDYMYGLNWVKSFQSFKLQRIMNRIYVEWCDENIPYDMTYDSAVNYSSVRSMLSRHQSNGPRQPPVLIALIMLGGSLGQLPNVMTMWSMYPEAILFIVAFLTLTFRQGTDPLSLIPTAVLSECLVDRIAKSCSTLIDYASKVTVPDDELSQGRSKRYTDKCMYQAIHALEDALAHMNSGKVPEDADERIIQEMTHEVSTFLLTWPDYAVPRDVAMAIFAFLGDTYEKMHRDLQCMGDDTRRCGVILPTTQVIGEILRWGSLQLRRGDPPASVQAFRTDTPITDYSQKDWWNVLLLRLMIAMRAYTPNRCMNVSPERSEMSIYGSEDDPYFGDGQFSYNPGTGLMKVGDMVQHLIPYVKGEFHNRKPNHDLIDQKSVSKPDKLDIIGVDIMDTLIELIEKDELVDGVQRYISFVMGTIAVIMRLQINWDNLQHMISINASIAQEYYQKEYQKAIDSLLCALLSTDKHGYCALWQRLGNMNQYFQSSDAGRKILQNNKSVEENEWIIRDSSISSLDSFRMLYNKEGVMPTCHNVGWEENKLKHQAVWVYNAYFEDNENDWCDMKVMAAYAKDKVNGHQDSVGSGVPSKFIDLINSLPPTGSAVRMEMIPEETSDWLRFTPVWDPNMDRAHPVWA